MAMGGDGPMAVTVMWVLLTIVFILLMMRVFTRFVLIKSFGVDDYVFVLAFFFLLMYTIFIQAAALHGFGKHMKDVPPDDQKKAILFEAIGQTFCVLGVSVAKWSLGFFLLRIVKETWHKIAIWVAMGVVMTSSLMMTFAFWLGWKPYAFLWDKTIPGGRVLVNQAAFAMILAVSGIIVDFFFALFPWLVIWNLNMPKREKLVIIGSLSLGVIAGACGIKRATETPQLANPDYLKASVGLIVWSAAEMAVTLICIGVPICRPLFKKYLAKWTSRDDSSKYNNGKYQKYPNSRDFPLKTFGGSDMSRPGATVEIKSNGDMDYSASSTNPGRLPTHSTSKSYVIGGRQYPELNDSDEEILAHDRSNQQRRSDEDRVEKGILVTEEYSVESSRRGGPHRG